MIKSKVKCPLLTLVGYVLSTTTNVQPV